MRLARFLCRLRSQQPSRLPRSLLDRSAEAHRGLDHLPQAEKVVLPGDGAGAIIEATDKIEKRHRGLDHLPDAEKVVLDGEGAGKIIEKTAQEGVLEDGNGVKGRVRRHLAHLHGHKRAGVDW